MRVRLVRHDEQWASTAARLLDDLARVVGIAAIRLEHVGSTSVPGLKSKPVIDLILTVADPVDEASYIDATSTLGYWLRHREPDWFEHRMLRLDEPSVNLHVFADDCVEVERMLSFRDVLRADPAARRRYEEVKQSLAARDWPTVQDYADAKSNVICELLVDADQPD